MMMSARLTTRLGAMLLLFGLAAAHAQLGRQQGLLDPNVAAEKDLLAVPHLSPAIVKAMLGRRPLLSMTELDAFLGQSLSPDQRKQVYTKLFLHLNLNAASREELLLIPGMGNRMVGEFFEYRPFQSFSHFRREIGKYVDEKEVARLEQYVFLPIPLNSAPDQDILTIPGLGPRMLHEFKEYRPYPNIERFRREIGKYVSEKEVGRLERYLRLD
jgi:DNA uptake protein ComE-like DNA-binding protein